MSIVNWFWSGRKTVARPRPTLLSVNVLEGRAVPSRGVIVPAAEFPALTQTADASGPAQSGRHGGSEAGDRHRQRGYPIPPKTNIKVQDISVRQISVIVLPMPRTVI